MMPTCSIIIPAYNELHNLQKISKSIREIAKNSHYEIIFVDNGSTDKTTDYLISEYADIVNIKCIRLAKNAGYGGGIREGLKIGQGNILSWTHSDGQCDIKDIVKGVELFKNELINNTVIVKGKRRNRKITDRIFTKLMSVFIFFVKGHRLDDINGQPKIFSKKLFKDEFSNCPRDFSLDYYLLKNAELDRKEIKTIDVDFNARMFGKAKGGGSILGKIKLIKRTILYVLASK